MQSTENDKHSSYKNATNVRFDNTHVVMRRNVFWLTLWDISHMNMKRQLGADVSLIVNWVNHSPILQFKRHNIELVIHFYICFRILKENVQCELLMCHIWISIYGHTFTDARSYCFYRDFVAHRYFYCTNVDLHQRKNICFTLLPRTWPCKVNHLRQMIKTTEWGTRFNGIVKIFYNVRIIFIFEQVSKINHWTTNSDLMTKITVNHYNVRRTKGFCLGDFWWGSGWTEYRTCVVFMFIPWFLEIISSRGTIPAFILPST